MITNQAATRICFTACRSTIANALVKTFALSGDANNVGGAAAATAANCPNDFLLIPGGIDNANNQNDRYCGTLLNAAPNPTICTTLRDFNILYRTNAVEPVTDIGNVGFCLDFEERVA